MARIRIYSAKVHKIRGYCAVLYKAMPKGSAPEGTIETKAARHCA